MILYKKFHSYQERHKRHTYFLNSIDYCKHLIIKKIKYY